MVVFVVVVAVVVTWLLLLLRLLMSHRVTQALGPELFLAPSHSLLRLGLLRALL